MLHKSTASLSHEKIDSIGKRFQLLIFPCSFQRYVFAQKDGLLYKNKTHPQINQGWEKNCYEKEN